MHATCWESNCHRESSYVSPRHMRVVFVVMVQFRICAHRRAKSVDTYTWSASNERQGNPIKATVCPRSDGACPNSYEQRDTIPAFKCRVSARKGIFPCATLLGLQQDFMGGLLQYSGTDIIHHAASNCDALVGNRYAVTGPPCRGSALDSGCLKAVEAQRSRHTCTCCT